ncbi:anillin, actin binding protein 2 isoform X2 [Larimichthys crocea]|uniref:anillin, actin binding protein 2 isoform X2 n=1 Tax=Larimichthys crocea TaxID=215358 RepID=UPI000F5F87B3|nr:anillin isoform X2 [Larimichthys crocea]
MDAEDGVNLKRPRAPLSDSEDNVFSSPSEGNDGQKRRRLGAGGQENRSPKAASSSSGRLTELETKPDTPMVPSVRSRVQQLTQRRDGGAPLAQRCLSDPGADSPSIIIHEKRFREHLLGEGEFHQRVERFEAPLVFQATPGPITSPANPCPRSCTNFVSGIQQKLQGTTTPSSKQASRLRQEREQELSQLQFQPISENAWLKRSSSDPSLTQGSTPPGPSFSSWLPTSRRRVHWPPMQPWDADGDGDMTDGSFTENLTPGAEKKSSDGTGETSVERENSLVEQLQNPEQGEEVREENEREASAGNEEQSQTQTVLKLSFNDDQSSSRAPVSEEPSHPEEANTKETSEEDESEVFSLEELDGYSYSEEGIEASTDEELRLWRYPQKEEESVTAEEQEEDEGASECDVSAEDEKLRPEEDGSEPGSRLDQSKDQRNMESSEGCYEVADISTIKQEQTNTGGRSPEDERRQQSDEILEVDIKEEDVDQESDDRAKQTDVSQPLNEPPEPESSDVNGCDAGEGLTEVQVSEHRMETEEMEQDVVDEEVHRTEGGESSKKVTFILEPELIHDSTLSETNTSMESRAETSMSDAELSSHDETNTAEIIDQMFEEVLEYAGRMEGERVDDDDTEDHDSGIGACSGDKDKMDTESEKEKSEEEEAEAKERERDESQKPESNGDELLTFPPSGILSPLSKSVEAVVTPLRLAVSQESNPPSLLLTPEETSTPPAEAAPLYSIDAYRTQRQSKQPAIQSVTPGVQRRAPEKSRQTQPSVNTKEKITALNEEAGKLQSVMNQTLQALSCCTDEEHGRGSLEEAEAEKLLLVSCEKRSALLAEVSRLREERNSESGETSAEDYVSQQPCRGTVGITNIQLPLKVEFVCSSHNRTGRPSHYFFVLIRYGPCNIVATPLATAADAQNGDTISFPTSVTLKDIRSSFEIDVEVYSLSHTSGGNCSMDRATTKSRVTPRKLLNTITRSSNSLTPAALPALNTRRSSNFCLVGSHKITLTSLGHSKFPLDKMKLEGKIRRLLGDEFQEKVPFLSPLEGNIYLRLDSESHSNVQHQGFLTMFELISGYGVWHRRYFVLDGCNMFYWNHPNDKEAKDAEGSISLSSSHSQSVRPVKRDSCARPFTFELVSNIQQQQQDDSQESMAKCWFSADTKQERLDWMEKLNQALLDFHTWNRTSAESQTSNASDGKNLRESIL